MPEEKRPKYPVLLPKRNGLRYLPHAVDGVLTQGLQEFELVISDDHSTDGTDQCLHSLDDPRIVELKPDADLSMRQHFEFILLPLTGTAMKPIRYCLCV